ncbi:MAG TPA: MarR family transcriptional regulator [Magnetospirillaceae bacterium]|nr:MarR family transcriptional regulator [Magnetospirillaceae bacterium]
MKLSDTTTYQTTLTQARAHRALKTKLSYFLRPHNLTMMQWAIVGSLYGAGETGMRVSDLAHRLDTSLAFVTTTLNVLEAKAIVSRSSHAQDNRAKIVRLTETFRPSVDSIEKEVSEKLQGWLVPSIGSENLEIYVNVIDKIARAEQ